MLRSCQKGLAARLRLGEFMPLPPSSPPTLYHCSIVIIGWPRCFLDGRGDPSGSFRQGPKGLEQSNETAQHLNTTTSGHKWHRVGTRGGPPKWPSLYFYGLMRRPPCAIASTTRCS